MSHHQFQSRILDTQVGLVVAVPPNYSSQPERRYPAVYMFPGIGGNEWSYLHTAGLEGSAIRALFEDPARAPILVFANPGDSGAFGQAERVLAEELVAFVDATYRTHTGSAARSLEGFSLGGVTVLRLLTQRPDVFGRAAAASSACYLLPTCDALLETLRRAATQPGHRPVLLSVGAKEALANQATNEEFAPLFGTPLLRLPGADHDLAAQLETSLGEQTFGQRLAHFHLAGFSP